MFQFLFVLRELLRIFAMELGLSNRRMAEIVGCSHPSVGKLKVKIGALTYTYDEYKVMSDDKLISVFYPKMNLRKSLKRRPDFLDIEAELNIRPKKYGKKRKLMFLEYREKDPSTALGQTQFYHLTNKRLKNSKLELKQEYFPGEYLSCDYAGIPLFLTQDGTKRKVYVFVACLPFSRKMFAFATLGMTANDWILGLSQAALYFGKIAKIILFDNAKAMVRKPGLIAELSDRAIDFSQYHNCVCDTSRVATPRDNCHSEKSVQFIEYRISLVLRRMTFFTLDELNKVLINEVEKLNNEIMLEYKVSRNELFSQEVSYLMDLPNKPYELIIEQGSVKAPANYLIKYQENYYSIPYQDRSKMVEFKATNKDIKILCKGLLIAQHHIVGGKGVIVRLPEHMPKNHLAQVRKTKTHFVDWAKDIGEHCIIMIEAQYEDHANLKSQLAGKRCIAIQKIAASYISKDFDDICKYGIEHEMFSPSDIRLIGQSGVIDDVREDELLPALIAHNENIRGAHHYEGRL